MFPEAKVLFNNFLIVPQILQVCTVQHHLDTYLIRYARCEKQFSRSRVQVFFLAQHCYHYVLNFFFSWIKHNIAKLAQIDASDLSQLFNANRAFLLQDWLSQTRKLKAEHKDYVNHPLQMSLIDKKLIQLKGNITDFRDYIANGIFRQEKHEIYEKIRCHLARELKIEELATFSQRTGQPFFNQYMKEEIDFSE